MIFKPEIIARLKEQYGLSDKQIDELANSQSPQTKIILEQIAQDEWKTIETQILQTDANEQRKAVENDRTVWKAIMRKIKRGERVSMASPEVQSRNLQNRLFNAAWEQHMKMSIFGGDSDESPSVDEMFLDTLK